MQSEPLIRMLGERLALSEAQLEKCSSVYNKCWQVLQSDNKAQASMLQGDSSEDVWRPCLLWLIKSLVCKAGPESQQPLPGLPLGEMLNLCKVNLVSFFKELPVVVNTLKPVLSDMLDKSGNIEASLQLREWQETLVSLQHISNKYKDLFWHIARSSSGSSSSSAKQPLMRAGWLVFLLIKAQLLPGFPDLVSCLELLVCVLNLLLASTPFTAAQLATLQSANPQAIDSTGKFNTLKALSQEAKVDYSKTKVLMPQIEARFRSLLEGGQFSWAPSPLPNNMSHPNVTTVDTACGLYLECLGGAGRPEQMGELVLYLDQEYSKFYLAQGEIDERDFLLNDFGALASPRAAAAPGLPAAVAAVAPATMPSAAAAAPAAAAAHAHPAKPPLAPGGAQNRGRAGITNLFLESPLPLMQLGHPGPATPITQAMGSVAWLRGLAKETTLEPNDIITRYMTAAGADAERVLVERVHAAAEAVFLPEKAAAAAAAGSGRSSSGLRQVPELQQHLARERSEEGIKLYWHVLQSMLAAEESRAGLAAASQLLLRWSFHQCLLACAFELVAASYRMGILSFPAIPNKLGLKPFDLSKMIGPFVRAEPTLPRELKRHMFTVEEKVLESLGWAPGSSFYKLARAAAGQQQQQGGDAAAPAAKVAAAAVKGERDAEMKEATAAAAEDKQQQQEEEDAAAGGGEQLQHAELEQKLLQQIKDSNADSAAAVAAAKSRKRSTTGSPEPMDASNNHAAAAAAAAAAGSSDLGSQKRQRSESAAGDADKSVAAAAAVDQEELPLPRAIGPPGAAAAGGDAGARAVLHDYCRKVLKLAAYRMVAVSEGLDFSPMEKEDVVAAAHDVLTHALYNHTQLFYGRHLDTLLLASLYGYCKVNRLQQITFREIISHYKRQAHAKQEVFRTVVLKQTDPTLITQSTGDIIAFYNAVYVPAMKGYLLTTVQQQQQQQAAAAPGQSRQHSGDLAVGLGEGINRTSSDVPNSPITTALMLAAQQQQRGWAAVGATSPAGVVGSGSAYRALSLAGSSGGGGLGAGLNLGGGISSGLSLSLGGNQSFAAGTDTVNPVGGFSSSLSMHGPGVLGGVGIGGLGAPGLGGWGDDAGAAAATVAAAAAMPQPMGRPAGGKAGVVTGVSNGGAVPSRLSRLSRVGSGDTAAAAAVQQQSNRFIGVPKSVIAAADQLHRQQQLLAAVSSAAAADAAQQQDQDRPAAAAPGSSDDQRGSTPDTAAADDTANMDCDDSAAAASGSSHGGGSSSRSRSRSGSGSPRSSSGLGNTGVTSGSDVIPAGDYSSRRLHPPAGAGSPAALTNLMRALDTSSSGGGASAPATAAASLVQKLGQQQQQQTPAVVMQD